MKILVTVISIVIGFITGIGFQNYYPDINYEEKINLIDLATLCVTAFLALYVPSFLERNMHNKRSEKEVLIRRVENLQRTLNEINEIFFSCVEKKLVSQSDSYLIIRLFILFSNQLETIITLTGYSNNFLFPEEFKNIKKLRYEYKKIVTGEQFQTKGFNYSTLDINAEGNTFFKLDKELSLLIIKINNK